MSGTTWFGMSCTVYGCDARLLMSVSFEDGETVEEVKARAFEQLETVRGWGRDRFGVLCAEHLVQAAGAPL